MAQVIDDDVRVVVGLQEPISVGHVIPVDVIERLHRFCHQVRSAVWYGDVDGRESPVVFVAREQQYVTASSPRLLHRRRLGSQVLRRRHHPAEQARRLTGCCENKDGVNSYLF